MKNLQKKRCIDSGLWIPNAKDHEEMQKKQAEEKSKKEDKEKNKE